MLPEQELVEALARIEALEAELKVHLENLNSQDAKIDRLEAERDKFKSAFNLVTDLLDEACTERDELREAAQAVVTSRIQHSKDLVLLAALLEEGGE